MEVGRKGQGLREDARQRGLEGADVGAGGDAAQGGREGDDAQELRESVVVLAGKEEQARGVGGGEGMEEGDEAEGLLGRPRRARTAEQALGSDE